jgi:hypothetical protein
MHRRGEHPATDSKRIRCCAAGLRPPLGSPPVGWRRTGRRTIEAARAAALAAFARNATDCRVMVVDDTALVVDDTAVP